MRTNPLQSKKRGEGNSSKEHGTNNISSMKEQPCLLVFTDLDGTLLDHDSYSFEAAVPALATLKEKNIPLIICTSKTRAEIEVIRGQLQNRHPFVSENGGAIFIPRDYFSHPFKYDREDANYHMIELGIAYSKIREVLKKMDGHSSGLIRGFGDSSIEEVAMLCGFSLAQARLAKMREYDEPFFLKDIEALERIQQTAENAGLHVTQGGRFFHLLGKNDKGKAVLRLKDMYKRKFKHVKMIGLGDSLNDLQMLEIVDYPVLVQKPDGSCDPSIKLDNLIFAPGIGPIGWNAAVMKLLDDLL
jgi:mannosyl-3-phosphoglycerate phosphatase